MVYIHVPFCASFCTYCDFYSEKLVCGKDASLIEEYVRNVCVEAEERKEEIEESIGLNTLYIGGGTPSVLPLSCIGKMVSAVGHRPYEEFTVEVNPEDVVQKGTDYVRGLVGLGVNRISMGVQSLDDGMLRWMNRRHTADTALKAFKILREAGLKNISVDIIFGVPGMDETMLVSTLREIIRLGPEHVSAYQLSIEDGSALAGMIERGQCREAPEELCRNQYGTVCTLLREAGYRHYEISNWALPGCESRHNSAYWKRLPYVGLGPGAHSLRGRDRRSWNSCTLFAWTSDGETLSEEEIREETLMLGLRTCEGVEGRRIPEPDWFIADSIIAGYIIADSLEK